MPVPPLDDRALDALLSGAPAESGLDWLLPFLEDLGEAARGPAPAMVPALALLLAEGFSTEKPAPQAAGLPKWRKKMLVAKFAGLGLTLVAASTTAAGAVGVLPAPAQHAVATVVEAATPLTFPDSQKAAKEAKEAKEKSNFGATVSADATGASDGAPGVDGQVISDAAKNKVKSDDTSNGVGANRGSKGLDRANETPAAGHVPTSVPVRNGAADVPGSPAANGLGTANSTPAAGKAPTSVPPVVPGADAGGTRGSGGRVTARP